MLPNNNNNQNEINNNEYDINDEQKEEVEDEKPKKPNTGINPIKNNFNKISGYSNNRQKNNMNNNDNNTGLKGVNNKNNNPTKITYNKIISNNLDKKEMENNKENKKENNKEKNEIFDLIRSQFFLENQRNEINTNYIQYSTKKQLKKLINDNINKLEGIKFFTKQLIEMRILPLFENKNYDKKVLAVLKNNISVILELLNIDKNYYNQYYEPQTNKTQVINRNTSIEARKKFRKEYGVGEDVIRNEQLEKKLEKNNYNFAKTLQQIYD